MRIFVQGNACIFSLALLALLTLLTITSVIVWGTTVVFSVATNPAYIATDPAFTVTFSDAAHTTAFNTVFAGPNAAIAIIRRRGRQLL